MLYRDLAIGAANSDGHAITTAHHHAFDDRLSTIVEILTQYPT
jgi:hypothetical protein